MWMHIGKRSHVNIDIRVSGKTVNQGRPKIAGDHQDLERDIEQMCFYR